jgi:hypothetical protein
MAYVTIVRCGWSDFGKGIRLSQVFQSIGRILAPMQG